MENSNNRYKFRAWQTHHKEMYQPFVGYIEFPDIVVGFDDGDLRLEGEKNVILMQFTGLKDKNGKEIYEGDIVKEGVFISQVVWNTEGAYFHLKRGDTYSGYTLSSEVDRCEVVGDIYTTPELLNPAKD